MPQPPVAQKPGTPRGGRRPAEDESAERPEHCSSTLELVPRFGESERGDLVPRFAESERSEADEAEGERRVSEREAARREVLRHCVSSKSVARARSWESDLAT